MFSTVCPDSTTARGCRHTGSDNRKKKFIPVILFARGLSQHRALPWAPCIENWDATFLRNRRAVMFCASGVRLSTLLCMMYCVRASVLCRGTFTQGTPVPLPFLCKHDELLLQLHWCFTERWHSSHKKLVPGIPKKVEVWQKAIAASKKTSLLVKTLAPATPCVDEFFISSCNAILYNSGRCAHAACHFYLDGLFTQCKITCMKMVSHRQQHPCAFANGCFHILDH